MQHMNPYLTFPAGTCQQALDFYVKALDGKVESQSRFGEIPNHDNPATADHIMHAVFTNGKIHFFASDSYDSEPLGKVQGISLMIECSNEAEVDSLFAKLSEGGAPAMPPADQFWGARFAFLIDRFGIQWMLHYMKPQA